jgi:hypothetical protein
MATHLQQLREFDKAQEVYQGKLRVQAVEQADHPERLQFIQDEIHRVKELRRDTKKRIQKLELEFLAG